MSAYKHRAIIQDDEKLFVKKFQELCRSRSHWQVWQDVITMMACSISNAVDRSPEHWQEREDEYMKCLERVGSVDDIAELFAIVVNAFEREPEQDFLGKMFMNLELYNNWRGQFFTPYSVAKVMAQMTMADGVEDRLDKHGFISISDPACGAGVTLIAAADIMHNQMHINYQNQVLFVGQDIDRMVAQMCYIQLSLLGCPGYICVANTLTSPMVGPVLFPREQEDQEYWYTPMFFSDVWQMRRLFHSLPPVHTAVNRDHFTDPGNLVTIKEPDNFFYFNFEEVQNGNHRQEAY